MDRPAPRLDFAAIGHQDNWHNINDFINGIRNAELDTISEEQIRNIFSFIPPRDIFRVNVRSTTGAEINGVYIETFIDPDKLGTQYICSNITKVMQAVSHAQKMGAQMATLGGFTSIVLEGNLDSFSVGTTYFTTGNTLTAAYIVKGIEKAALQEGIELRESAVLIIGATGDIGLACVQYLKTKTRKLLLCARNEKRLEKLVAKLRTENIAVEAAVELDKLITEADCIICAASSSGIQLKNGKKKILVCDAGYPKNLEAKLEENPAIKLFHGGMGQVSGGFSFNPDYSHSIYRYPAPRIIHGCILEAMVLAFENKWENYSAGKGHICEEKMEEIYQLGLRHGITLAPFYNASGIWQNKLT